MKVKTCFLFLILFWAFNYYNSVAQDLTQSLPSVPTPNSYSNAQFLVNSADEYSGIPDISIPVITIKDGDITIPVALCYYGGGIKVEEEASWVGLGWNLSVGGEIIKVINGKDDGQLISNHPCRMAIFDFDQYSPPSDQYSFFDLTSGASECAEDGCYQPDIYYYSFPGHGGAFYYHFTSDGTDFDTPYFLSESEKLIISREPENDRWVIIDSKGIIYIFNYTTGKLGEVRYPNGQKINYFYESGSVEITRHIATQFYPNEVQEPECYHDTYTPEYLSRITTTNYEIVFNRVESRLDIPGESYLESIEVWSTANTDIKRSFFFNYSYFEALEQSTRFMLDCPELDQAAANKRLKLDEFYEEYTDDNGNVQQGKYEFIYNSLPLPPKNSFSRDYWGYYNGKNNLELIPLYSKLSANNSLDEILSQLTGTANRGSDKDFMDACMLESIIYPTGKTVSYVFGPHKFNNFYYESGGDQRYFDILAWDQNHLPPGDDILQAEFTLNYDSYVTPQISIYDPNCPERAIASFISIYKDGVLFRRWTVEPGQTMLCGLSERILFEPGHYVVHASLPDPFLGEECNVPSLPETTDIRPLCPYYGARIFMHFAPNELFSIGGGLRIEQIHVNDDISGESYTTDYIYDNVEQNIFNGKLVCPLNYYSQLNYMGDTYDILYSTSNLSLSNNSNASDIGYSEVTTVKNGSNENAGKTIKRFFNEEAIIRDPTHSLLMDLPVIIPPKNGLLTYTAVYDKYDNLKEEKTYHYLTPVVDNFYGICSAFGVTVFYPLCSYHIILDSYTEKTELEDQQISKSKQFEYNDLFQLAHVTEQQEDNTIIENEIKYTYDVKNVIPIANEMYAKNLLDFPFEINTYQNSILLNSVKLSQIQNSFDGSNYRLMTEFFYDDDGILIQSYSYKKGCKSYLWDFNNILPGAVIENCINQSGDIKYCAATSFENNLFGESEYSEGNFTITRRLVSSSVSFSGRKSFHFVNDLVQSQIQWSTL